MSQRTGKILIIILIALVFLVGVSVGKGLDSVLASSNNAIYKELELFTDAFNLIRDNYVEEVDTHSLIYGAIRGMVSSLDIHSMFLTPDEFNNFQAETRGSFGGIGISISIVNDILTIISPIEDTPGWKAGLKAGDQILGIDGKSTEGIALTDAVNLLRGKKGTKVTITIMREGWKSPRDFTLVREIIKIQSVKYEIMDGNIAYIRISEFQERTATDLKDALDDIMDQTGGKVTGVILDLRNDPGGLLAKSIEVADLFIKEGVIVSVKGRDPGSNAVFTAHEDGTMPNFPMVVLVNGGSASASEIVAGALKDLKRAILVGTKTFGKGSVQTILSLPDGSGLKITTAKYYTPSGISIHEVGIVPDIVVEIPIPKETIASEGEKTVVPEETTEIPDIQLEKAKEIIKNWTKYEHILK